MICRWHIVVVVQHTHTYCIHYFYYQVYEQLNVKRETSVTCHTIRIGQAQAQPQFDGKCDGSLRFNIYLHIYRCMNAYIQYTIHIDVNKFN